MNKFVSTALVIGAVGSVSWADPGDNEWLELDSEIEDLASSLKPSSQDGMGWSALIRAMATYSGDDIATGTSNGFKNGGTQNPDITGFSFADVDLAFWGAVAEYGWRVSFDFNDAIHAGGGPRGAQPQVPILEDAYGFWDCGEYFTSTLGQFKPKTFQSASIDPENLFFVNRTALGATYDWWDIGYSAEGFYEQFGWYVSITNQGNFNATSGFNGPGDVRDSYYVVRVDYNHGAGSGGVEGALGGTDELNLTTGLTFTHNDNNRSAVGREQVYGIDVLGNYSSFGFGAELAFLDDGAFLQTTPDFSNISGAGQNSTIPWGGLQFAGDSTPWSLFGTYLITPEWEVGVRYENLDNGGSVTIAPGTTVQGSDNSIISVALVWYRSGRNAKWTAQWTNIDAGSGANNAGNAGPFFNDLDGNIFQIGLTLGATR